MKRMNLRHLLYIGRNVDIQSGFSAKVYIVGVRARTVHYAHGACDVANRRAFPKWLQHGTKVFPTELLARDHAVQIVERHEERGYVNLKARQKPLAQFNGRRFSFKRSDGTNAFSKPKTKRRQTHSR